MISLREQIANIKAKNPDDETPMILALYDMIQHFVYSRDLDQMLFFDTTGLPPLMTTKAGTKQYAFPTGSYAVDVRKTSAILFDPNNLNTSGWGYGVSTSSYDVYDLRGREYYMERFTQTEQNEDADNTIWFDNDPGATTAKYYHLFFRAPPKIESVDSHLLIPPQHAIRLQACVLGLIAHEDYGDWDSLEYIENKLARRIWADMDKAKQGRPMRTPLRMQDRWIGNTR